VHLIFVDLFGEVARVNILFMGPPGAGKGTQAQKIASLHGIPHISTGDVFRQNMKQETPLGLQVKSYVDNGLLVPDELTNALIRDRLAEADCAKGFILDGYPRTTAQAEELDRVLAAMNRKVDAVLNLVVDRNLLLARLTGRRVCRSCGTSFHILFNPPKQSGVCDKCGGELYQRGDDTEEKVGTRLDEYEKKTAPLLDYYRNKGNLRNINGEQDIDRVTEDIQAILKELA